MAVFPLGAIGNTINLAFGLTAMETGLLVANVNSFAFDFCCRQKVSGTDINIWIFKQLPVISLAGYDRPCTWAEGTVSFRDWLQPRIVELIYTAWDVEPYAQDCGCETPPFRWDEERRHLLRCELDATFFHLYLPAATNGEWSLVEGATTEDVVRLKAGFPTPRDAVDYIMESFPIVKRKDVEKHGDYRTKLVILEIYDRMLRAKCSGKPYQTLLDPPPADPRIAHPQHEGSR